MQTKALTAEFLGTALIVASVVGSSFMGLNLGAVPAFGLLMSAIATSAMLFVVIAIFLPISGAHFNPAVSLVLFLQRKLSAKALGGYLLAQALGAVAGAVLGNIMFRKAPVYVNGFERFSLGTGLAELVATFGLVLLILLLVQQQKTSLIAPAVALWILAGHLFTSSTSFANPAVSLGRVLTEAAAGIAPESMTAFWFFQIVGALLALLVFGLLTKEKTNG